jgi:hypothetical protein
MKRFLRVGFAHYIDEHNCRDYGIDVNCYRVSTALMGMSAKALALGCITSQGEWSGGILYFTMYLHFDVSLFPSDWTANDFALSFDFEPCDPIEDGDPQTKSYRIVSELPKGCIVGGIDYPQAA